MKNAMPQMIVSGIFACLFAGCVTTMTVRTDYCDASHDFSSSKTYAWEPVSKKNGQVSETVDHWIRQAVDTDLQTKGYKPVGLSAKHALGVSYQVTVEKKTERLDIGQPYTPIDTGRSGIIRVDSTWQTYNTMQRMNSYTYEEGTLILDLKDPFSGKILWRGSVTAVIDPSANSKKRQARINEAVGKLLASFPPSPKQ